MTNKPSGKGEGTETSDLFIQTKTDRDTEGIIWIQILSFHHSLSSFSSPLWPGMRGVSYVGVDAASSHVTLMHFNVKTREKICLLSGQEHHLFSASIPFLHFSFYLSSSWSLSHLLPFFFFPVSFFFSQSFPSLTFLFRFSQSVPFLTCQFLFSSFVYFYLSGSSSSGGGSITYKLHTYFLHSIFLVFFSMVFFFLFSLFLNLC